MATRRLALLTLATGLGCAPSSPERARDRSGDSSPPSTGSGSPVTGSPIYTTPPAISALTTWDNPENVLSVWVTWTTDTPATTEVQFGPTGQPPIWRRLDPTPSTQHAALVIGLRPQTANTLVAISESEHGRTEQAVEWTSDTPPWPVGTGSLVASTPGQFQPGWTLMNLYAAIAPTTVAMFDEEGIPVWYYQASDSVGGQGIDLHLSGETLLIGGAMPSGTQPRAIDLAGRELWRGSVQPGFDDDDYAHHHAELLPSGNVLTLVKVFVGDTRGDRIVEIDPTTWQEVWSWNAFDWLPPNWGTDWTHCNWVGATDDLAWLSVKREHEIVHLDRATGEVIWQLGPDRDFTLTSGTWFRDQHSPSILPNGNVLVYDNGGAPTARVAEFTIDEVAMTATEVWAWDGGPSATWNQAAWGDADRLPNGNTLVTSARAPNRWVREVNPAGEVVWDFQLTGTEAYRSERLDPPGLERL